MQRQRITRELEKLANSPPPGISVSPHDDKLNILDVTMIGPDDTPYKNGLFKLSVQLSEKYPLSPPIVKFVTKVYHPNIDDNGRVCMDLTKLPPKGCWRPTIGLEALLISVRLLLANPNPDDPLMVDIADEYKNMHSEFVKKAKMYTDQYAC